MAHSVNVSSLVSKQIVQSLHAKGTLINTVDKSYSKDFTQKKYTSGQTVTIDIAPQATITSGRVGVPQDMQHRSTSVTLGQYNGLYELTSIQKGYDIPQWRKFGDTIAGRLIREMEKTGFEHARDTLPLSVGDPGSQPGSLRTWAEGRAKITKALGPKRNYHAAADPLAMVALTDALKGATNPGEAISNQYLKGQMKTAAGLNFYESESIARHTAGTASNSTPVTNGASTTGATTLSIDGLSAATATITKGTRFTIADVYAVDPETKQTLSYLREFVVTADKTGSGSAITDLPISPTIYGPTSGSLQNVSALPANDKAIVMKSVSSAVRDCNLIYDADALTLVSVPLPAADGDVHTFADYEGIQLRIGMGPWDPINDRQYMRVDAVWAWGTINPDHAVIVYGA
jgi:hypothetical protein